MVIITIFYHVGAVSVDGVAVVAEQRRCIRLPRLIEVDAKRFDSAGEVPQMRVVEVLGVVGDLPLKELRVVRIEVVQLARGDVSKTQSIPTTVESSEAGRQAPQVLRVLCFS